MRIKYTIIGVILGAFLSIAATAGAQTFTKFRDVPTSHPHASGIATISDLWVTQGYNDGTFRPDQPITRGEMATMLSRIIDPVEDSPLFMCEIHGNRTCGPGAGHRHTTNGWIRRN